MIEYKVGNISSKYQLGQNEKDLFRSMYTNLAKIVTVGAKESENIVEKYHEMCKKQEIVFYKKIEEDNEEKRITNSRNNYYIHGNGTQNDVKKPILFNVDGEIVVKNVSIHDILTDESHITYNKRVVKACYNENRTKAFDELEFDSRFNKEVFKAFQQYDINKGVTFYKYFQGKLRYAKGSAIEISSKGANITYGTKDEHEIVKKMSKEEKQVFFEKKDSLLQSKKKNTTDASWLPSQETVGEMIEFQAMRDSLLIYAENEREERVVHYLVEKTLYGTTIESFAIKIGITRQSLTTHVRLFRNKMQDILKSVHNDIDRIF